MSEKAVAKVKKALSAADIKSAVDIKTMWIDVPEWGGEGAGFWARQMTQGQTMRQSNDLSRYPEDGPAIILIYSAVESEDLESPYLFSLSKFDEGVDPTKDKDAVPTDLKMLRLKSMAVLDRIQRQLITFNKRREVEDVKKG